MYRAGQCSVADLLGWIEENLRLDAEAVPEGTECKGALWARVTAFRALKDNWNSYGAKAFPEATIQRAIKVACWLGDEWKCVPCADGPSVWFYLGDEEEIIEVRTSYEDPSAPQPQTGEKK